MVVGVVGERGMGGLWVGWGRGEWVGCGCGGGEGNGQMERVIISDYKICNIHYIYSSFYLSPINNISSRRQDT